MKADNLVWVSKKFMRSYFILMTGISLGKSWLMYCGLFCSREQTLLFSFGFGKKPFQPLHPDGCFDSKNCTLSSFSSIGPRFLPFTHSVNQSIKLMPGPVVPVAIFLFLLLFILCYAALRCAFGKNRKYLKRALAFANSLQ